MFSKSIVILHGKRKDESGVLKVTANGSELRLKVSYNTELSSPLRLVVDVGEVFTFNTAQESEHTFWCDKFSGTISAVAFDGQDVRFLGSTDKGGGSCYALMEKYKYGDPAVVKTNSFEGTFEDAIDSVPRTSKIEIIEETSEQTDYKTEELKQAEEVDYSRFKASRRMAYFGYGNSHRNAEPKVSEEKVSNAAYGQAAKAFDSGLEYQGSNFYLAVKPQLDEMFICYPREEKLERAVANSKWVKVDCENDYYVVGIIYEIDEPQYICYGIPGNYNIKPPEEIEELCDWVPLDSSNKFGEGYWMIFQNAENGKCVRRSD